VKSRILVVLAASAATLAPVAAASPADAARCVSGSEVRQQVSTFVHSIRDDVTSAPARAAVRGAFVESVKAARGAKADTPKEKKGLGKEISALANQLKDAETLVERKAIIAEIHALQEQKRAGEVTTEDVESIKADLAKVKRAIKAETDSKGEGKQVAAFVHALMAQFDC
jgi:hypothetical protein